MTAIGMLLNIQSNVPLGNGSSRKFAILLPSTCLIVQDVKKYIAKEFCDPEFVTLELCIDGYILRDKESVDLIEFFRGKTFEVFLKIPVTSNYPSLLPDKRVSLLDSFMVQHIDEVDTAASSSLSPAFKNIRQKHKLDLLKDDDDDDDDVLTHLERQSPSLQPFQKPKSVLSIPNNDFMEDPNKKTIHCNEENQDRKKKSNYDGSEEHRSCRRSSSSKRRERFKHSLIKRIRLDAVAAPNIEVAIDKENQHGLDIERTSVSSAPAIDETEEKHDLPHSELPYSPPSTDDFQSKVKNWIPKRRNKVSFYSEIIKYKNENKSKDVEEESGKKSQDPYYYETLKPVQSIGDIEIGDTIAFQLLVLENGAPVVSNYTEARVSGRSENILSLEYLKGGPFTEAKSEIELEGYIDEDSAFSKEINFARFLHPKKMDKPNTIELVPESGG